MRVTTRPTSTEVRFEEHEVLVSKTDPKGVLTYANDTFARISGYTQAELVGQPHNIVRHPDFPGGVFALMWDTISAGEEIFAFVKNMASDGSFYWVLAHVTPSLDAGGRILGYHSWRRLPERAAVAEIDRLYDRMRAEEARHSRRVDAARASAALLAGILAEAGVTYDEFVWDLIARTTPGLR